jgi:hypothetical protein
MSKREWSASDQTQKHGDEASKKRSGHLIADLGHHREVICTVWLSNYEPVDEGDDDRKLPTRREVPCASLLVDEDDDVIKKKAKKKAKKKVKKKAMSLSSVLGAKITEEQLSAQDPSNITKDWNTPGKYHPVCVAIWTAWLNFVPVFLGKQTINGSVLHLVPPLLPWDAPHDEDVAALIMHYMPTQLTNSVKGDLHPASAKRSDGSLRSNCWELVCQSVGVREYEELCLKMNYSPWAHLYNGKRTDIFSMEDSLAIMESYQVFLLFVFNTVARTHLCSQAVQNQVTALYGGKTAFREYVKVHPDKFFSALKDSFQTCCHPEFLLNERYRNEHTERYAELWDEIYSEIRSYFGNPDKCIEGNNIVMKVVGSVSFELLKKAAEEKNARTSERMRDLAERGEHPWQLPEFIKAHSERTSMRMRDLVARGEHLFQQPEFIEENSKQARALVDVGEHLFQQPEFIEETSKQARDLVARGEHLFQQPEFIEENSKQARALVDVGEHLFQQPEFIEETSKQARALVARGEHLFQQPEYKQQRSEDEKKRQHDKRKLSSGSTEEATYYAIDGADENGRYILITEIFGTNDLNFRKSVKRRNGKRAMMKFHTMEAIDELYLRKCSAKTCTNKKCRTYMLCKTCLGYN